MKRSALLLIACVAWLTSQVASPAERAASPQGDASDAKAVELAAKVMESLGGEENWNNTRFIRFTFIKRRTHYWDKWNGRHRLEGENREGKPYLVLHNINSHEGRAFLDGEELQGEARDAMLKDAYAAWVNDTYWLLMPYKMRDPGVTLKYDGEEEIDGRMYDKVVLTFQSVGLTPGDRYWAYINRRTMMMDRWAYRLESMPTDAAPVAWDWQGWSKHGNIMLAPMRHMVGKDTQLPLDDIAVYESLPDSVFDSPEPVTIGQ